MQVEINGISYVPLHLVTKAGKFKKQAFHSLIREARTLANESLDLASQEIGCSKSYLWNLEQGGSEPGLAMLQRILRHYHLHFEQIEDQP